MKKGLFYPFITLLFLIAAGSCDNAADPNETKSEMAAAAVDGGQASVVDDTSDPNIVRVAVGSADHTTLVAAVQAAGLTDVLANNGPFTVFAPTNAAFEKLPPGTVDDLLKPENKDKLARIIKFHAAPGTYRIDMLKDGMKLFQATGHYIPVEIKDGEVFLNGAKILGSVDATNGVIHVVDAVLLPPD